MNRLLGYLVLTVFSVPACRANFFDTLKTKLAAATAAVTANTKNAFDAITHHAPVQQNTVGPATAPIVIPAQQASVDVSQPTVKPVSATTQKPEDVSVLKSDSKNSALLGGSTPLPIVPPSSINSTLLLRRQVSESLRADRAPIKVMQRPVVVQPTPMPGKSVSLDSVGAYDRPLYTTVDVGRLEYLQARDDANNQMMNASIPTPISPPALPDMTRDSAAAQQAAADQQAADQQKMQDLRDARDTRNAVQIWKNGGGAGFGVIGNVIRERNRTR